MLKTLKKFFDFCGKENRKLFIICYLTSRIRIFDMQNTK